MTSKRRIPFVLSLVLLFSSLALAQSTIQGVVKDNVGNGMEKVSVQVAIGSATRTAMTDSDGKYTLANVPAGAYTITFEADKYKTVKRPVTVPASGNVSVNAVMVAEETVGVLPGGLPVR